MSALLEHPIDIMVCQSSHVKMRFSFDLNFIFEIFFSLNSAGIFKETFLSPFFLKAPHLCYSFSTKEQNFMMGQSVVIVH